MRGRAYHTQRVESIEPCRRLVAGAKRRRRTAGRDRRPQARRRGDGSRRLTAARRFRPGAEGRIGEADPGGIVASQ